MERNKNRGAKKSQARGDAQRSNPSTRPKNVGSQRTLASGADRERPQFSAAKAPGRDDRHSFARGPRRERPAGPQAEQRKEADPDRAARVIYGVGPIRELVSHKPHRIVRLLVDERRSEAAASDVVVKLAEQARLARVSVGIASREELDSLAGEDARHQGVVAILGAFEYADIDEVSTVIEASAAPALWVALDGVEDPRNLGAVIRTAYLAGAHGVIIPEHRAASVTAVTAKASAGASELMPIVKVGNLVRALQTLKQRGVWTMAVHASPQSKTIASHDCKTSLCLVMGAEGSGVRQLTAENCDFHAVIPMTNAGVGSYNISVAAAMALYEVMRQRG
jgi:23S rRNA (guanosine2251-2'-O)-methyltransferase